MVKIELWYVYIGDEKDAIRPSVNNVHFRYNWSCTLNKILRFIITNLYKLNIST